MKKQYILNETEMRKILLHLQNSIVPKDDLPENHYAIVRANHYDLLDELEDTLGVDPNSELINPETLEIYEW